MAAPKLLNLDELAKLDRQVTIKGNTYAVAERSLGRTIEAIKMYREMEAAGEEQAPEKMMEQMVIAAREIVPECPIEVIRSLSVEQVSALIEFATASDQEVVEGSVAEDENPTTSSEKAA